MASLNLDKVNCENFQIILHQYFLYSSKVCGSECCLSYSPIVGMRISDAAAGWVDLALSHSVYYRSQCLLILSNDLELIWGHTVQRHIRPSTVCVQTWQLSYYDVTHTLINLAMTWKTSISVPSDWSTDASHWQAGTSFMPSYFLEALKERLLFTGRLRSS